MRIALLASGFVDYSLELAGALQRRHTVLVVADRRALARERGGAPPPPGVELWPWRQEDRLRRWGGTAALALRLGRWRPDAVLAHEHPHPHLTLLMRLARRSAPLGLLVHDPEPHPGRDAALARRRSGEITVQRALADRLFAHGRHGSERLAALSGRPVTAVPHGPLIRPEAPPARPPGERRLLVFGRMEAYKGLETLIAALQRLAGAGVPFGLEVRGEGPELARLAGRFAALGPGRQLHPGPASRPQLLAALAGCDLVVAPYLHASASGVAAAAMANGRGMVASDVGGLAEMVRPGVSGVLAPPGDAAALAAAVAAALPLAERFGAGALSLAEGPFAWSGAAEAVAEALRPAVAGRRR